MTWYIVQIALLLTLAILVHELGHFIAAKWAGVRVLRFSIGFPPLLFRLKRGETEYAVGAIPFGGYVKLAGEEWQEEGRLKSWELMAKPFWVRIIIYASGVAMNVVMAWAIFYGLLLYGVEFNRYPARVAIVDPAGTAARAGLESGDVIVKVEGKPVRSWDEVIKGLGAPGPGREAKLEIRRGTGLRKVRLPVMADQGMEPWVEPVIGFVEPLQPGRKAGLKAGDRIEAIDGHAVRYWGDISRYMAKVEKDKRVALDLVRGGRRLKLSLVPRYDPMQKRAFIGISARPAGTDVERFGIGESAWLAARYTFFYAEEIGNAVWKVVTRKVNFKDVIGGPVLIARVGYEKAKQGATELLHYVAFLCVSLVVVNLLPIPAVDGGMILLAIIEGIRRRRFPVKVYEVLNTAGLVLILSLFLFATWNDLRRG